MRSVNSLVTVGDCGQLGVKSSALCVGDSLLAVQLFPAGKEGVCANNELLTISLNIAFVFLACAVRDCMAVWVSH